MPSNSLSNVLTGVLALCAVLVTIAVVKREFLPQASPTGQSLVPRHVSHWQDLSLQGELVGPDTARVKVVEFADFQCPYCRELYLSLETLRNRHAGRLAILYRHFPLSIHPHAFSAAVASECAAKQGKFEPFYRALFEHQDSIGITTWEQFAKKAGLSDVAAFDRCRSDPLIQTRVNQDAAAARSIGVAGTPVLVVRDQVVLGAMSVDSLESWIRRVYPEFDSPQH